MALPRDAMEASRTGAALRPGETQVAGIGKAILPIFKALLGKQNVEGMQKLGEREARVPTPVEERLVPGEYEARQAKQAQEMLSPEGLQRFNEAGRDAQQAIRPDPTIQAAQQAIDETPVEDVVGGAREALRGMDAETMEPRPTIASVEPGATEADAADVIRMTSDDRVADFVRGDQEGLDFNFDNLETGDDIKAAINVVSEIYADPTEAAKRGVQTNIETMAKADELLADELGLTRSLLKRKQGELLNGEQMLAVRQLLIRSGDRLIGLARRIEDGDRSPGTMVQFRRQMALHAGIQMQAKGAQTEIARAMQAFNIPASARSPGEVADLQELMLQQAGGEGLTRKLAVAVLEANKNGGRQSVHKVALSGWRKAEGVFSEVYINGLLSWFPTHVKNAVGTPLFMAYQLPEELIAGLYGGVERGVRRLVGAGRTEEGVYAGQVGARLFGLQQSARDAWLTAARTFRTEVSADVMNKVEGAQFKQISAENLNLSGNAGKFFDALGKVIRVPSRALMAADDFWRVFAQRGELYSEAYAESAMAMRLGKSKEEAFDNFAMAILDPRSYAKQLDDAARYSTLTSDTGALGKVGRGIQKVPFAGKMLMPFVTAPTNGILRFLERVYPAGVLQDPVKRQKALARVTLGWGAMYGFHTFAVEGRFTGSYPKDKKQQRLLPPGWKPYSFVARGDNWPVDADGDKLPLYDPISGVPNGPLNYISYAGIEPVGAIVGIAADTAERMRRTSDPQARLNIASAAIAAGSQYFLELPMLQSVGDVVEALERGDFTRIGASPIRGMLPYSSAVANIEKAVDPTIRKPSGKIEYHTRESVEAMGIDENTGRYRLELVGTVKGGVGASFVDAMAKYRSMFTDRTALGFDEETSGVRYDILGKPRESSVRFDTNPAVATWNLMLPFNISLGQAPGPIEIAHMELGGPLREEKRAQGGFAFTQAVQSQWVNAAKNEVRVMQGGVARDFRSAMGALVRSPDFRTRRPNEPYEQMKRRKHNAMRELEDQFFDAALRRVLNKPENTQVSNAYADYIAERERQGFSQ